MRPQRVLLLLTAIFIGIIPFFWMHPGQIDIGGDSTRLYFYDPYNYFLSTLRYVILPVGLGPEENYFYNLPFVLLMTVGKMIFSSFVLISLMNTIKLVVGFLSIYLICRELLKSNFIISTFAGLFYIFSPILVRSAWDKAIMTHNQFFINPLIFLLLLLFIKKNKIRYLLIVLLLTFIFSANFTLAAPPFFAFFPIVIIFLFLYKFMILKGRINIKSIFLSIVLLLLIHLFHIVPTIFTLLHGSGSAFSRAFTNEGKFNAGLNYFIESASHITLSNNLLSLPQLVPNIISFEKLFLVVPFIIVTSLFFNLKSKNIIEQKIYLLIFLFYLLTLYLVTANITNAGFDLYKNLFDIPGFSMFRNYYGQWAFVNIFFLTLIVASSLSLIFVNFKNKKFAYLTVILLGILIVTSAFSFIKGDLVRKILNPDAVNQYQISQTFDPEYEKTLQYIRRTTDGGKYLSFPFTESFYQLLAGTDNGMYEGPSTISHLTGNLDIPGYQNLSPYSESFLKFAKEKDYESLINLFQVLNIQYIFYNEDPRILHDFSGTPYNHVKNFLPKTQTEYKLFIKNLPIKEKAKFGKYYHIYELDKDIYLPTIYSASKIIQYNDKKNDENNLESFLKSKEINDRSIFIYKDSNIEKLTSPKITVQEINPTKFYISVHEVTGPYFLVFSQEFNSGWELRHQNNVIAADKHIVVNDFANGWYITPENVEYKKDYHFVLEINSQKYYYVSLIVSFITVFIIFLWLIGIYAKKIKE